MLSSIMAYRIILPFASIRKYYSINPDKLIECLRYILFRQDAYLSKEMVLGLNLITAK